MAVQKYVTSLSSRRSSCWATLRPTHSWLHPERVLAEAMKRRKTPGRAGHAGPSPAPPQARPVLAAGGGVTPEWWEPGSRCTWPGLRRGGGTLGLTLFPVQRPSRKERVTWSGLTQVHVTDQAGQAASMETGQLAEPLLLPLAPSKTHLPMSARPEPENVPGSILLGAVWPALVVRRTEESSHGRALGTSLGTMRKLIVPSARSACLPLCQLLSPHP